MDQEYKNNDQWTYVDGELYHAGVKGMQWGKHLPGTDWWKKQVGKNIGFGPAEYVPGGNKVVYREPTFGKKVVANIKTAGQAAKIYGRKARLAGKIVSKQARAAITRGAYKVAKGTSKLWNQAKGYSSERISELRNFAKNAWSNSREAVTNFFTIDGAEREEALNRRQRISSNTPLTHLDTFQNKQLDEAVQAYLDGKDIGSFSEKADYYIQNAQYGIVKGINNFLKKIGMDDEVDNFLNKFNKRK